METCIILAQLVMILVAYSMGFLMDVVGPKPLFLFGFAILPIRAVLYTLKSQGSTINKIARTGDHLMRLNATITIVMASFISMQPLFFQWHKPGHLLAHLYYCLVLS